MHSSGNSPQGPVAADVAKLPAPWRDLVAGIWQGRLGVTVRCVPTRRTVKATADGACLFGKWRVGRLADAHAEWNWLAALPALGLPTPQRVVLLCEDQRSLLVTAAVAGQSLLDWAVLAHEQGWGEQLLTYVCEQVAPRVRALHDAGLCYRDCYWNHIFAADPRQGSAPTFLDVERVLRPRWRFARWRVKDLAGLLSSAPATWRGRAALRFLRAYCGGGLRGQRSLLVAVQAKAARILAHQPRYG